MLENASVSSGTVALFHGPQGCGKTLAAEAVAYELGRTIREISASDLLLRCFSGISGAAISASKWLSSFFASARESGSVIVVMGAEVFISADVQKAYFSSRANGSTTSFGIIDRFVQQIRQYTGVTIL
uniref:ATPase AAA-type core domain-containing protein n=1 Tax=Ditylum brightwellii TaxID=49249 RepID=A0A7S1ZV89_9STRA|mmetsp:Transcript_39152/g.58810  ORF Transcript_39152/g.58810 Transcript_39152/m.58810 type:complete len:128 (+) Transcript_39152:467-850(+)